MEFYIGQTFDGMYPPEAAAWCNANNAHIEKINGVRTIVENAKPVITHDDLIAFVTAESEKIAYGGIYVLKDDKEYLFSTTTENITLCNGLATAMTTMPDDAVVSWEVLDNGVPVMLPITKAEFTGGFSFGTGMIVQAFAVKGHFNSEQGKFTDEQMQNEEFIAQFKAELLQTLETIPRRYSLDALAAIQ